MYRIITRFMYTTAKKKYRIYVRVDMSLSQFVQFIYVWSFVSSIDDGTTKFVLYLSLC